jgi:hypothetical protein
MPGQHRQLLCPVGQFPLRDGGPAGVVSDEWRLRQPFREADRLRELVAADQHVVSEPALPHRSAALYALAKGPLLAA